MTPEEEKELTENQENVRFNMLESILAIPLGRRMFFEPFNRLIAGDAVEEDIVDRSYWTIKNDRLHSCRRSELKLILDGMGSRYQNRESVCRLHLSWFRVEKIGKKLFSGIETCRQLVNRRKSLLDLLGEDATIVSIIALEHCSCSSVVSSGIDTYRAWNLYPQLSAIRNELDLIEVTTGVDIHDYSTYAQKFRKAINKYKLILERFVEANLRLVVLKVRKYYPCNAMEEMDLVQEGCKGLMDAVRRFDYRRGYKLSTFAVWWIRQAILKAILRQSRLVRLPDTVLKTDAVIRKSIDDFTAENGYLPTIDDLVIYIGIEREEIERIYLSTAPSFSLDHTTGVEDATIADIIGSKFVIPDEEVLAHDLRGRVEMALTSLSDREKTIITLRFGLLDGESCTLQDLGRIFRISRERVRQLESRALRKLREHGLLAPVSEGKTQ